LTVNGQTLSLHIFTLIYRHQTRYVSLYKAASAMATATPPMAHCAFPVICGIPPVLTAEEEAFADAVPVEDDDDELLATVDIPDEAAVDAGAAEVPVEAAVVAALAAAFVVAEAVDAVVEASVVAAAPVRAPAVMVTGIQADV
jgi:hypothetical protein